MKPLPNKNLAARRPTSGEEERLLLAFGQYLSDRMKPASVAMYQSDIRLFAEDTPGVNLLAITEAQEDQYIEALHRMRRKERTIQRKGTAFRYFREFVAGSGLRGKSLVLPAKLVARDAAKRKPDAVASTSKGVIDRTIQAFLRSLEKTHSRSTVRGYRSDLSKFRQVLQQKAGWQQVTQNLIFDFIDDQVVAGLNTNSAARLLSTLRSLFLWLQRNGHVIGNPALRLHFCRAKRHSPVPYVSDLSAMTSQKPPSSFSSARALLLFELLYRCGLRVSEISSLDTSSVDLSQQRLTVRGPQDRERFLDLTESTSKALIHYLSYRKEIADPGPLITNLRGKRLTDRSICRIIAQLSASGKLPEGTHPLTLRQACASHSLKDGKDMQGIRHDLGISGVSAVLKISD